MGRLTTRLTVRACSESPKSSYCLYTAQSGDVITLELYFAATDPLYQAHVFYSNQAIIDTQGNFIVPGALAVSLELI